MCLYPSNHFDKETEALILQEEVGMIQSLEDDKPKTIQEVLSSLASDKWKQVMVEEMESMKVNKVWTLVDLSKRCKAIDNK